MSATECKYSAFDRELLAAFTAIHNSRYALEGLQFQLWTDHKLLLAALYRVSKTWMPRQQGQLAFIAECTADIVHAQGMSNVVADSLSQLPDTLACHMAADTSTSDCFRTAAAAVPVFLDYTLMGATQLTCPGVVAQHASSSLRLTNQHMDGQLLVEDTSTEIFRPVVPFLSGSRCLMQWMALHTLAHRLPDVSSLPGMYGIMLLLM